MRKQDKPGFGLGPKTEAGGDVGTLSLDALIADDNYMIRDVIGRTLKILFPGACCQTCKDGHTALDAYRENGCQLAFVDLSMPDMSGLEVACRMRAMEQTMGRPPTPIVAISAHLAEHEWQRCEQAGFSGFIQKPFGRKELKACIQKFLPGVPPRSDTPSQIAATA
jgi:CheY-like chemotaxis protein